MSPSASLSYSQYKPRPMTDRDYWSKVACDPRVATLQKQITDVTARVPTTAHQPLATDFLAARRVNDRQRSDLFWQTHRTMLSAGVLRRCLDGETGTGVDDSLLDWLWASLTMPTWVVSAHLPGNDLPLTSAPQLDLAATEMAAVLAETAEQIKPWLENQSGTLLQSIIHEIDRRVVTPFVEMESHWWYDPAKIHNNWTGVCAGSILAACESLAALGAPRPKAREKAIHVLNLFLEKAFTPAGECDEGIGYWNYGVGFACLGWSRLSEAEFRDKVDVKRLKAVVDYPRQVHLFDDWFFSGNDAPLHAAAPLFASMWLAGATGSEWMAEWSRTALKGLGPWSVRIPCLVGRSIDALMHLEERPAQLPTPSPSRYATDQQVAIFSHNGLTAILTGGNNAESHNHNDLGHVSLWSGKTLLLADLGAPQYTADFFGPKRYTYLSASSRGHACPIINNQEQIPGRDAQAKLLEIDLGKQHASFDLTAAYPKEAKLTRWTRSLSHATSGFQLQDEFVTSEPVSVESVFWSAVEPKVIGKQIQLADTTLTADAGEIRVETVDPKPHGLRYIEGMLYRISIHLRTNANTPLKTSIAIERRA